MKHYNPTIAEDATRIFNLKNGDMMPEEIGEPVAVIPIEHNTNIIRESVRNASGDSTIYTTPTDKDFYLTSITNDIIATATQDIATGSRAAVTTTIQGLVSRFCPIGIITLTAISKSISINFYPPIKIDRGVTIIHGGITYTAGTVVRAATITGYTVETTKGV